MKKNIKKDKNNFLNDDIFEMALMCMNQILITVSEGNAFRLQIGSINRIKNIDEKFDYIKKHTGEDFWKQVFELSIEKKAILGFRRDIGDEKIMMIPIWIWNCLPDDMIINGHLKKYLNNKTKSGCVSWKV